MARRYWLMKTEPETFGIADLRRSRDQTTCWDGVRNYQARNLLRDEIQVGDEVLFYHSRVKPMVIPGTAKVVKAGYPDPSQFDKRSKYYDPGSSKDDPRWFVVDVAFVEEFPHPVTRDEMTKMPALKDMMVLKRGARLSVQPVTRKEWDAVRKRGRGR